MRADPSKIELDRDANLLLVVLPADDTIRRFTVPTFSELDPIHGLSDVTGVTLDQSTHVLYAAQLDGTLAMVDIQTGTVRERRQISAVGLTGISTSATRILAINTPGQELLSVDRASGELSHIALATPPASIVASSGTAYVLEPTSDAVVCLEPSNGAELGRIGLGEAHMDSPPLQADLLWVWPNMRIAADETVFMTAPSAGVVARFRCPARS